MMRLALTSMKGGVHPCSLRLEKGNKASSTTLGSDDTIGAPAPLQPPCSFLLIPLALRRHIRLNQPTTPCTIPIALEFKMSLFVRHKLRAQPGVRGDLQVIAAMTGHVFSIDCHWSHQPRNGWLQPLSDQTLWGLRHPRVAPEWGWPSHQC